MRTGVLLEPVELADGGRDATRARAYAIASEAELVGRGVHSGVVCRMRLLSGIGGSGIRFRRTDLPGAPVIAASIDNVVASELARRTTLAVGDAKVHTVEHVLSAARGLGVEDLVVEMDAPEPPFADGSAAPFVKLLREAGLVESGMATQPITLPETITFEDDGAEIVALPSNSFRITYFFTSEHPGLRTQSVSVVLDEPETYVREIAPARTFCFVEEIDGLIRAGLAKGASLASAVVIGRKAVLNESLRFPDEPARHKALDFIGDLALLGRPLRGHFLAWRSGHRTNARFAMHLKERLGL